MWVGDYRCFFKQFSFIAFQCISKIPTTCLIVTIGKDVGPGMHAIQGRYRFPRAAVTNDTIWWLVTTGMYSSLVLKASSLKPGCQQGLLLRALRADLVHAPLPAAGDSQ